MSLAKVTKKIGKGFYTVELDYDADAYKDLLKLLSSQYRSLMSEWLALLARIVLLGSQIDDAYDAAISALHEISTAFRLVEEASAVILQGAPLSFLKVSQVMDGERDRWANIQKKLNTLDTWAENELHRYEVVLTNLVELSKERENLRNKVDYNENERRILNYKISLIQEVITSRERTVNCIDYTVSLLDGTEVAEGVDANTGGPVTSEADNVGIIDIIGEVDQQFIYPGSPINDDYEFGLSTSNNHQLSIWQGQRDGNMRKCLAFMFPPAVYYDAAMLPGWQRWMPYYRTAKIVDYVYPKDLCDDNGNIPNDVVYPTDRAYFVVEILSNSSSKHGYDISLPFLTEEEKEKDEGVLINGKVEKGNYLKVPVEYMQTGGMSFAVGDVVVLDFVRRPPQVFIIGFALAPQPNFFPIIIEYQKFRNGTYYGWEELTDDEADAVTGNPIPFQVSMLNYYDWKGQEYIEPYQVWIPSDQKELTQKAYYNRKFGTDQNPLAVWEVYVTGNIRKYDVRGVYIFLRHFRQLINWTQLINGTKSIENTYGKIAREATSQPLTEVNNASSLSCDWMYPLKNEKLPVDRVKPGKLYRVKLPKALRLKLIRDDGIEITSGAVFRMYLSSPKDNYYKFREGNWDMQYGMHPRYYSFGASYDAVEKNWIVQIPACKYTQDGVFLHIMGVTDSLRFQFPDKLAYVDLWQDQDLITEDIFDKCHVVNVPYYKVDTNPYWDFGNMEGNHCGEVYFGWQEGCIFVGDYVRRIAKIICSVPYHVFFRDVKGGPWVGSYPKLHNYLTKFKTCCGASSDTELRESPRFYYDVLNQQGKIILHSNYGDSTTESTDIVLGECGGINTWGNYSGFCYNFPGSLEKVGHYIELTNIGPDHDIVPCVAPAYSVCNPSGDAILMDVDLFPPRHFSRFKFKVFFHSMLSDPMGDSNFVVFDHYPIKVEWSDGQIITLATAEYCAPTKDKLLWYTATM